LATMAKLKQVCNHPAHLLKDGSRLAGRSGKLQRLEQLAEEILAEGEKALLFTQYAEFGGMLQPYLARRLDRPVLWLHGGLPKKARDRLVDRFQEDGEPMLFLLSLKAAGVGLNLTAASHVVHIDRWWNPAVEEQATDRAFRIGQRKNVQVRKLICAGTLEERVDELIERKKELAERVVAPARTGWRTCRRGSCARCSGWRRRRWRDAVRQPDQGRGRHPGAVEARLDRVGVVVAAVHRHPGADLRPGAAVARARLRTGRAGAVDRPVAGPGLRVGAGLAARTVRGDGRDRGLRRGALGGPGAGDRGAGRLPGQAAGRGDAGG